MHLVDDRMTMVYRLLSSSGRRMIMVTQGSTGTRRWQDRLLDFQPLENNQTLT